MISPLSYRICHLDRNKAGFFFFVGIDFWSKLILFKFNSDIFRMCGDTFTHCYTSFHVYGEFSLFFVANLLIKTFYHSTIRLEISFLTRNRRFYFKQIVYLFRMLLSTKKQRVSTVKTRYKCQFVQWMFSLSFFRNFLKAKCVCAQRMNGNSIYYVNNALEKEQNENEKSKYDKGKL